VRAFEPPAFREDIQKPSDLLPGMVLEGVVTNIVAFGCFVDIGVHQDGLVHVSQLADRYMQGSERCGAGGAEGEGHGAEHRSGARNRIALSMKSDGGQGAADRGSRPAKSEAPVRSAPKPAVKAFVPAKGAVAPNGIRFK
jgi:uncharacterized protein